MVIVGGAVGGLHFPVAAATILCLVPVSHSLFAIGISKSVHARLPAETLLFVCVILLLFLSQVTVLAYLVKN